MRLLRRANIISTHVTLQEAHRCAAPNPCAAEVRSRTPPLQFRTASMRLGTADLRGNVPPLQFPTADLQISPATVRLPNCNRTVRNRRCAVHNGRDPVRHGNTAVWKHEPCSSQQERCTRQRMRPGPTTRDRCRKRKGCRRRLHQPGFLPRQAAKKTHRYAPESARSR